MILSVAPAADPLDLEADLLLVPATPAGLTAPEGTLAALDAAVGGALGRAVEAGTLEGTADAAALFPLPSSRRARAAAVVGVGPGGRDEWYRAGRAGATQATAARAARVAVADVPQDEDLLAAFLEGLAFGTYRFQRFVGEPKPTAAAEVRVAGADGALLERIGAVIERVNAARDLVNTPGNHLTPTALADHARALAERFPTLTCEVLDRERLEALGAGALLAVAQGSSEPPALIVLRHRPERRASDEVLGIVGKGVTFDSGGISIKPSAGMEEMKMDMGGAAAALEGTALIAALGVPVEVLCVVPTTENMPGGRAVKPGDVVTALNGTTIEITNTDAEGRLILADGLTWAARNGATRLVDLATLTGAVLVALGETYAGLMGADEAWNARVRAAGDATGDLCWPLPLHRDFEKLIESRVADVVNTAKKRLAGTIYAAHFLQHFTEGLPWCHLDIAGTAMPSGIGGSGFGVRLLLALAEDLADER